MLITIWPIMPAPAIRQRPATMFDALSPGFSFIIRVSSTQLPPHLAVRRLQQPNEIANAVGQMMARLSKESGDRRNSKDCKVRGSLAQISTAHGKLPHLGDHADHSIATKVEAPFGEAGSLDITSPRATRARHDRPAHSLHPHTVKGWSNRQAAKTELKATGPERSSTVPPD